VHYEGTIDVKVPKEKFYEFITDPSRMVTILPGVEETKISDSDHFFVKAKLGAGPIRGSMSVNFTLTEKRKGASAKLVGHGEGMQGFVDLTLVMNLSDAPHGSIARWSADARVGGLLSSVAGRLIEGIASTYIKQVTENLREQVAE
jgi:carbon monoxide dehydrogenase subunit G